MAMLSKLFGDANKRFLQKLEAKVSSVNDAEPEIKKLSDAELKKKTDELKKKIAEGFTSISNTIAELEEQIRTTLSDDEKNKLKKSLIKLKNEPLDAVLPETFAVVREAALRTLKQRHFDVQILGGIVLHDGQVAEMKTGEGKTLTSTLSIYLNALTGKGVHVITVNDYLARRDAVWMGQIFDFLGLSVGTIIHDTAYLYDPAATTAEQDAERDEGIKIEMEFLRKVDRKKAYEADVTYGTNNEFGFDYLRDNMVVQMFQKVQRKLHYAIIDEVDSILIDEARTPLIISAPHTKPTDRYYEFARLVEGLEKDKDFTVDEKQRAASLTEQGIAKVEKLLNVDNIYVEKGIQTIHHIEQALKAKALFARDKEYTVKDGQVIIVDEFTGRMLHGRRYSEGLHQAIEAKEGLEIQQESRTMATITFQNYFRLYEKLTGMTGTAETEAEELAKIYNLEVTTIPTHKPMIRDDRSDRIYKTEEGKYRAVVQEIKERTEKGQPILVGTISIEKNEYLGDLLAQEGLTYKLLNAKQHESEAETIAQAGKKGAVTIATNMAGRGVDIKLGGTPIEESKFRDVNEIGGLHVIGTERHESRRIDNQLRGRSGRQGEPGSSQFYVSLEDDLMRIFGAERVKGVMKNWPDDMPIENAFISKSIESAQKRVEGNNFDIRKHLVEYDDVINKQRTYVYNRRNEILLLSSENSEKLMEAAEAELEQETDDFIDFHTQGENTKNWDMDKFSEGVAALVGIPKEVQQDILSVFQEGKDPQTIRGDLHDILSHKGKERLKAFIDAANEQLRNEQHPEPARELITTLMLRSIDMLWVDHLETISYLRTGIGLRGYGQRDPLVEYKKESRDLFNRLLADIRKQFVYSLMNTQIGPKAAHHHHHAESKGKLQEQKSTIKSFGKKEEPVRQEIVEKPKNEEGKKIGRNDPCPCGSGKKYKKCHGS